MVKRKYTHTHTHTHTHIHTHTHTHAHTHTHTVTQKHSYIHRTGEACNFSYSLPGYVSTMLFFQATSVTVLQSRRVPACNLASAIDRPILSQSVRQWNWFLTAAPSLHKLSALFPWGMNLLTLTGSEGRAEQRRSSTSIRFLNHNNKDNSDNKFCQCMI